MGKRAAVTETKSKALAKAAPPPTIIGPHVGSEDLLVPKILAIHYMSEKAKGKNASAKPGEFRDTVENRLFGDLDKPFDFIPIHMTSFFAEYHVRGENDRKYLGQQEITAKNEKLPREEMIDGKKINRMRTYEVFVLLPEEVKAGTAFPFVLSFRSTSIRGGKTLLTQMYVRNRDAKKPPYAIVCEASIKGDKNDKGDFFVVSTKPKREATEAEQKAAQYWLGMIAAGAVKKDDSDLEQAGGHEEMKNVNSDAF